MQQAVLDGRADAAVHSAKDLPTERPHQLDIAAIMARRSSTDALIGRRLLDLEDGDGGYRFGAASLQISRFVRISTWNCAAILRPGCKNPDSGSSDAVSALEVLNLTSHIAEELDPAVFVPAVGQGAIAIECRNTIQVLEALAGINDETTAPK